ncbi:SusD/RagB family nutrient-binding outer membrane lipoprotein [Halpernia frigidisoli]|uniref:Starch-binding associating with outer membrane n=1 Tax=Halpernia frigidisoli TaxID=1125876 RepID=A0A1I3HVT1_9FLAO|nr:SusD/RagB family nutrient-binding outer membrane lipoprotein [Halpernia frigidisoli]SFI39856.1 Starch-binding associating with outer membrane [Halpernia frigidisoli]
MKNIFKLKLIPFLLIGFIFTSCSHLFEDDAITSNPNSVTDVDVRTLLSGTLLGISILHEDTDVRIASMWSREVNGLARAHLGFSQYIVASTNFSWTTLYPVGGQARLIQEKADQIGDKRLKGVGEVIEALVITKATSLYGDVPYSQAFNAEKFPNPVFDAQLDVYKKLQTTLDDAILNLSATTGLSFVTQDFIYKGDVSKWKKAAYTLKARLYLHTANYQLAADAAKLGISDTSGDALVPHGKSQNVDTNLNYDFFKVKFTGDVGFNGAYLPILMNSRINSANTKTNETALFKFFATPNLTGSVTLDPNTLDGAFTNDAPHPILTYYENQLTLAEAQARLGTQNEAIAALNTVRVGLNSGYMNGKIFSNVGRQYDAYTSADFLQAGLANPNNFSSPQMSLLYEIISQRYIVFLMQYESFNDYRRLASALPIVQLPIPLSVGSQKPQRFIYPETEINTNPNTPSPAPNQFTKTTVFK